MVAARNADQQNKGHTNLCPALHKQGGANVVKLNIASMGMSIAGYTNVDDVIYPLGYKQVDEIRASHILEHYSTRESVSVLANWVDCLRFGGVLKIAVPDFDNIVLRKRIGEDLPYEEYIMGGQVDDRDFHKSIWTYPKLHYMMSYLGLTDIKTWQSEISDCASLNISLNLRGVRT